MFFFETNFQEKALKEYRGRIDEDIQVTHDRLQDIDMTTYELAGKLSQVESTTNTILKTIVHADDLTDDQRDEIIRQFPVWAVGMDYKAYDVVNYDGVLYEVIQSHTSQDDWRPDEAPALYAKYLNVTVTDPETGDETEIIHDFVQPTGGHDAYNIGDKVRFDGDVYESLIDGNVWSPADNPEGWEKV